MKEYKIIITNDKCSEIVGTKNLEEFLTLLKEEIKKHSEPEVKVHYAIFMQEGEDYFKRIFEEFPKDSFRFTIKYPDIKFCFEIDLSIRLLDKILPNNSDIYNHNGNIQSKIEKIIKANLNNLIEYLDELL